MLYFIFLFVLMMLSFGVQSDECSRSLSRRVRDVVHGDVFKVMDIEKTSLPDECQLNPKFDMYLEQEQHKLRSSDGHHRCKYCGKEFKNEMYIDRHMSLKHSDLLQANATTCLADLCPIFGCAGEASGTTKHGRKKRRYEAVAKGFHAIATCTDSEVEKIRYKCEVLSRRCFGSEVTPSGEVNDLGRYFNEQVCNKLHCESGVMKGVLRDVVSEGNDPSVLATVLRWMFGISMLIAIFLYSMGSGLWDYLFHRSAANYKRSHRASSVSSSFEFTGFWRRIFGRKAD